MSYNDDDDEPLSNRPSLERADHRKQEREMQKLKKDVEQKRMQKLKRDILQKDVRGSIIVPKDTSTPKTFGPKSHEDQATKQYEASHDQQVTPDDLIAGEQEVEQIRQQSQEEQQSEPG